ncbi:hypothetical protein A0H81_02760 [Grifola frondosa]|uniref:Uncharacterized protein n=1 Tax=Grifola frondosa TaxID=5627 RepID=A0A1C7MR42_GRIFR|nr:hypothetical protein A0H81_02760 [Grifola frondosa]
MDEAFDGGLIRKLWPYQIGVPLKDKGDVSNLPAWKLVPPTSEEISEWIVVEPVESNLDGVERPTILYHPSLMGVKTKVSIRVQGFVESVNIGPLGNWDGKEHSAGAAMQHLTLSGGGLSKPFTSQLEAIEEFRMAVMSYIDHDFDPIPQTVELERLHLSRRVFYKIPLTPRKNIRSALRAGDDPRGSAAKIAHRWKVPFRVRLGVQHEDGKIVPTSQIGIRKGDFIDVSFVPEIITKRSRQGVRFELKFDVQDVVRLYTRNEFSDDVLALLSPDPLPHVAAVLHEADSGFTFDTNDQCTPMVYD